MLITENKLRKIIVEELEEMMKEMDYTLGGPHQKGGMGDEGGEVVSSNLTALRDHAKKLALKGDIDRLVAFSSKGKDHQNMAVQGIQAAFPNWREDPKAHSLFKAVGYYK